MRRPAQHHLGPIASTGWAHPYRGIAALAVFHNDGGQGGPPAAPTVPTPADVAARAGQQPAAPVLPPAAPVQPAPGSEPVLLDHGTGEPMTQAAFTKIMARENAKGRRATIREIAEAAGVPFDPDNFDVSQFGQAFKAAETARQERLTEEQKRQEELTNKERALEAREAAAAEREAEAARRDRASRIRQTLVTLGATGTDLEDAAALLRVPDDADDAALLKAAEELKARRAEMFGGTAAAQTLPPAPSGAPAGGNAPRQPVAGKDAVKDAARKRAEQMGLRQPDKAA
ncbi:hypothetical protein [Streptomyces sp. NPDC060001]|uniref:hypothetical protein n=1 Tax=Streptomyces sp. NPDC060001 TaxID=3347032 RepID=UPI0036BCEE2A